MPNPRNQFNLFQCNPATLKSTKTTCLPTEMLEHLRSDWNDRFPQNPIPARIRTKEALWTELKKRLRAQFDCESEFCALQVLGDAADKSRMGSYFRPVKPATWEKDPTAWQETDTIAKVLEQYEDAFPHFEFIGPVPIDFDAKTTWGSCIVNELCNLNLATMRSKGARSIGIVFNLDPHDKSGSHWVCAYIDLVAAAAYYYDSYGLPPCPEIQRLLRRCKEQGCREVLWNDIRHQRKESECGTYCMYVLISLLQGHRFLDICRERVDDDTMNALRDILFATKIPRPNALSKAINLLTPPST